MFDPMRSKNVSTGLAKVAERARRDPQEAIYSLAHLIDVEALGRSFDRLRKDAAVGVDGVTKDEYGKGLDTNLRDLHARMKAGRYRHQPIRRVHIPKGKNKTRPIGIATTEDKVVQGALREVLEAVYEPGFRECSHGFRPGRSAHDAIRALDQMVMRERMTFILEADIVSFFDSIDRKVLMEMLRKRVADKSLLRLVGKCLHVGVLDGEDFSEPEMGTTQGSVLSPLLGNVYLHHVLDTWFEDEVKPRLRGNAKLIRYCDDFIIGFETHEDAQAVLTMLEERMGRYGLQLHPDKTRLVRFERPPRDQGGGKGPGSFDFVGFTVYWERGRTGSWRVACKTRRASFGKALRAIHVWCRGHRHEAIKEQHAALCRRIQGHFNYFGINGNVRSLERMIEAVKYIWLRWLRRRSQRTRLTWERYDALLASFPLPHPRVYKQIWG